MAAAAGQPIRQATYYGDQLPLQREVPERGDRQIGLRSQPVLLGEKELKVCLYDNPKLINSRTGTEKSRIERIVDYLETAGGQFRVFQTGGKTLSAIVKALEYSKRVPSDALKACDSLLNKMWQGSAIVLIPSATWKAYKALSKFSGEINPRELLRSGKQRNLLFGTAQKVCYAGAMWGYGTSSVTHCTGNEEVSKASMVGADHIDFFENASSICEALNQRTELLEAAKAFREDGQERFATHLEQSATAKTIKTAKSILSMVGLAFSYIIAANLFASAPVIAAIVSLGSTLFAVGATFYGDSREHKVSDPFDSKHFMYRTPQNA